MMARIHAGQLGGRHNTAVSASLCTSDNTGAGDVCRSYRLVITAVKDPASANSVQLAKLDLFTQLDPTPQPSPSLLGSVHQLHTIASLADAGSGSAVFESVGTLLRVLCNIVQHPTESKHRTLRVENAKIKAMLSGHSEVFNLLRIVGTLHSLPQNKCDVDTLSCSVWCTQAGPQWQPSFCCSLILLQG